MEQTRISIDPITRLEGHGKIEIFLNDKGEVDNTYFQIPELRRERPETFSFRFRNRPEPGRVYVRVPDGAAF